MSDLSEKVTCIECGKPVSVRLAERRGGRCLRCDLKRNPFFVLYGALVERVCRSDDGFDFLSESEKLYYALTLFQNEVNNGGFDQFFFNRSGSHYDLIESGLQMMGEATSLELLRQAREIVFPGVPVPVDTETRRNAMPVSDPDAGPPWVKKLNDLDQQFYAIPDTLTPKLQAFAREHGLVPAEDPTKLKP